MLSLYLLLGPKAVRVWLDSMDGVPQDWPALKERLREAMERINVEMGITGAFLVLERHLPGRFFRFKRREVHYRREWEALFKIEYNPRTNNIHVRQASFNWDLWHLREEFNEMERGRRWTTPPLIPWRHRDLGDPKLLLTELSGLRYPDYDRTPKRIYIPQGEMGERRGSYEPIQVRGYAPRKLRLKQAARGHKYGT